MIATMKTSSFPLSVADYENEATRTRSSFKTFSSKYVTFRLLLLLLYFLSEELITVLYYILL
jgi:hypothetical protein